MGTLQTHNHTISDSAKLSLLRGLTYLLWIEGKKVHLPPACPSVSVSASPWNSNATCINGTEKPLPQGLWMKWWCEYTGPLVFGFP